MSTTYVFVAHAKGVDDATLMAFHHGIVDELEARNPGASATRMFDLTLARDDFLARGQKLGWDNWARSIAAVSGPVTRTPRFNVIMVPVSTLPGLDARGATGLHVGRGTSAVIKYTQQAGRVLRAYVHDRPLGDRLFPITGAHTVDANDWKAGWVLTVEKKRWS